MEIQEAHDLGVIVLSLISSPISEPPRLDTFKRVITSKTFRARIAFRRVTIPLKAIGAIKVHTLTETQGSLLPVLAPQTVILPGVDVSIGVECRNKYPVEFLQELGYGSILAIGSNEGVSHIIDAACTNPFSSMRATGDDNCLARLRRLIVVSRVYADPKCGNITAFIGHANVDYADVSREERLKKPHPWGNNR